MARIRPFRPGDEAGVAEVCVRTAWSGGDATGRLSDDGIWPAIFVLPYVARHPESAFVVETDDARIAGYVVGAPDTAAFEDWFATHWWPTRGVRWPHPEPDDGSREASILRYAAARRAGAEAFEGGSFGERYPAHLHIDLLPGLQGQGWGRRLIETFLEALRAAGVRGVHLVASADNAGAIAFYPRVGFAPAPSPEGVQVFVRTL